MQSIGFISFMSAMVHPNAFLTIEDKMIIDKMFSSPKSACFKLSDNGLSSSFGGDFNDRLSFFPSSTNPSILKFKPKWVKHIYKGSCIFSAP